MTHFGPPLTTIDISTEMQTIHARAGEFNVSLGMSPTFDDKRLTPVWLSHEAREHLPDQPPVVTEALGLMRYKIRQGILHTAGHLGVTSALSHLTHEHFESLTAQPGQHPPKESTTLWHPDIYLESDTILVANASFTARSDETRPFVNMATEWLIGPTDINLIAGDEGGHVLYEEVDVRVAKELARGRMSIWPNREEALRANGKLLIEQGIRVHRVPVNQSSKPLKRVFYNASIGGIR